MGETSSRPLLDGSPKEHLPREFGPRIRGFLDPEIAAAETNGSPCPGTILRIDKFGNLITNLTAKDFPEPVRGYVLRIAGHEIRQHLSSYAEAETERRPSRSSGARDIWKSLSIVDQLQAVLKVQWTGGV